MNRGNEKWPSPGIKALLEAGLAQTNADPLGEEAEDRNARSGDGWASKVPRGAAGAAALWEPSARGRCGARLGSSGVLLPAPPAPWSVVGFLIGNMVSLGAAQGASARLRGKYACPDPYGLEKDTSNLP